MILEILLLLVWY